MNWICDKEMIPFQPVLSAMDITSEKQSRKKMQKVVK